MIDEMDAVLLHLHDLEERSSSWHRHLESGFLSEEEQALAEHSFPASSLVRYEGGYEGARKKKVIFCSDAEDDFSDIVCISAKVDQRFSGIGHRDILGALFSLQIDRHSFGDFWIDENRIYLYTSSQMAGFLQDNLTRIGRLSVQFEEIPERPVQVFRTREFNAVIASTRADAMVAALAHVSRAKAKEMIRQGLVQLNHRPLADADEVCNNSVTISIRGVGRFQYVGTERTTRSERIVAVFQQSI